LEVVGRTMALRLPVASLSGRWCRYPSGVWLGDGACEGLIDGMVDAEWPPLSAGGSWLGLF
jgi:hypothetical protein